ncbi:hypothetical protein CPB86DRAFT_413955 [Serendipita vermifera]|nr:hypothetical protein CPB86DRAFT_413955 [Serendipita vermifera]
MNSIAGGAFSKRPSRAPPPRPLYCTRRLLKAEQDVFDPSEQPLPSRLSFVDRSTFFSFSTPLTLLSLSFTLPVLAPIFPQCSSIAYYRCFCQPLHLFYRYRLLYLHWSSITRPTLPTMTPQYIKL